MSVPDVPTPSGDGRGGCLAVLGMTGIVLLFPGICSLLCMISFLPGDRSAHGWGLGDHLPHRGRRNRLDPLRGAQSVRSGRAA